MAKNDGGPASEADILCIHCHKNLNGHIGSLPEERFCNPFNLPFHRKDRPRFEPVIAEDEEAAK